MDGEGTHKALGKDHFLLSVCFVKLELTAAMLKLPVGQKPEQQEQQHKWPHVDLHTGW
jgi:hypothetical protein